MHTAAVAGFFYMYRRWVFDLPMCGPPQQALARDDDDLPALVSADAPEFIFVLEKQARGAMHFHFLLFLPREGGSGKTHAYYMEKYMSKKK